GTRGRSPCHVPVPPLAVRERGQTRHQAVAARWQVGRVRENPSTHVPWRPGPCSLRAGRGAGHTRLGVSVRGPAPATSCPGLPASLWSRWHGASASTHLPLRPAICRYGLAKRLSSEPSARQSSSPSPPRALICHCKLTENCQVSLYMGGKFQE